MVLAGAAGPGEEVLGQHEALFVVKVPPAAEGEPARLRVELRAPPAPRVLMEKEVRAVSGVRLFDLVPGGAPELVIAWERPGTPPEVVALTQGVDGALKPLLAVEARGFELDDATGDGRPDLVVHATLGRGLAQVPVVHHLREGALVATKVGTTSFYARYEKALRAKIDAKPPPQADDSYANDRLVDLLDLGLLHEHLGRKPEAFRAYQELLARAQVPARVTREDAARRAAPIEIAREARRAMAKIAGLRLVGEPRPSPSPVASPR